MAVLLLLGIEPLHPYGLRRRIHDWDKDRVVNVTQRNSVYQTVERLERAGLITQVGTAQQEKRPDKTLYRTTEEGAETARRWLLELLTEPVEEYPSFPAALAFLGVLPRETVLAALRERARTLAERLEREDAEVAAAIAALPEGHLEPVNLIEYDYLRTMCSAELAWLERAIEGFAAEPE
ncbi:Predicted transcriptional regulator [Streptantibioticus cattleyicolor NRRL 8057 = DSM 46488]|nr:Predicted transcriptional regulator [Streptantibioticus cattleyicolor NRRL 8057 = DSM 46488]